MRLFRITAYGNERYDRSLDSIRFDGSKERLYLHFHSLKTDSVPGIVLTRKEALLLADRLHAYAASMVDAGGTGHIAGEYVK